MTTHYFLKNISTLFFIIIFLLAGCNSGVEKNTSTSTTNTDTIITPAAAATPPAAALLSGKLDTLWTTATEFKNLNKSKAFFIFNFGNDDTITLDGWKDKGGANPFNTAPDVRFLKGKPDGLLTYGPGTYFGNLVIKDVGKIQKIIRDSLATHVLFAPYKSGNHVYYKIFVSKDPHMMVPKTYALIPANNDANPSPPKVYN